MSRPMSAIAVATALVAASLSAVPAPAGAADLKVISAGAVRGLIAQIIDDYSARTGPEIRFHHRHHRPAARHHRLGPAR